MAASTAVPPPISPPSAPEAQVFIHTSGEIQSWYFLRFQNQTIDECMTVKSYYVSLFFFDQPSVLFTGGESEQTAKWDNFALYTVQTIR